MSMLVRKAAHMTLEFFRSVSTIQKSTCPPQLKVLLRNVWRPTLPGYGLYDVFVWNMLSLNGMRPFGGKPNTKTVRAWLKVDNIISFRAGCYIGNVGRHNHTFL